jgi:hypothetical protein
MKYPASHTATPAFAEMLATTQAGFSDGTWAPSRPLPFYGSPLRRLRLAWAVFTGRADALFWVRQ